MYYFKEYPRNKADKFKANNTCIYMQNIKLLPYF